MPTHAWNPFLRFPRASLAASLLLCLPFFLLLPRFKVSSETRVLLEGDQRNLASYEKVRQILANVDVYNVMNASSILQLAAGTAGSQGRGGYTYGPRWLVPSLILEGRVIQFSGQLTF